METPGDDEPPSSSSQDRSVTGRVGAVVGLVLAAAVAGPWVGRGHVLLLDWVSGPQPIPLGSFLGVEGNTLGGTPFLLVVRSLRSVVGPSASSWLPLVAWMPVVGWGVGRLTRRSGWPAAASAAALACCNPFTLDRLAVGQVAVLWAYALLPLAVLTLTAEPRSLPAWAARAGLVGAALTAVTPHFFAYWLVIVLVAVALQPMVRRRALGALLGIGGALVASCYLFVVRQPSITVGQADLGAYRTRREPPGLAVTIMTLRGFWRQGGTAPARSWASWALILLLGACVALGIGVAWRRREAVVIAVSGLVGAFLAAGDQGFLGGLYRFAFDHVGPFRILREPQKASALLAIALSVFFGVGVARIVSLLDWRRARAIGSVVLASVPLGSAPGFVTFGSRVDVGRPSAAWREADRLVGPGPAGVLALPWHLYLRHPTTEATVSNLAPTRFRATVVSGDNVELGTIGTTSTRRRSQYLTERFGRGAERRDFGAQIEPAGLGWVLLVKSVDWTRYQWVEQQQDLVRVLDTPELALYRSTAPTTLNPGSATRAGVAGWRVRSPDGRPVPLPEVTEGRWSAAQGRVDADEAGAPAVVSAGTSVRSSNVHEALLGLAFSAGASMILVIVASGRRLRAFARRSRASSAVGER